MTGRVWQAAGADQAVVEEIVEAAYQPWAQSIGFRPGPMEADYATRIAAGHVYLHGDDQGGVDGLIVLIPEEGRLLIENVAVRPQMHGRGIGRRLMGFAEDHARALGLHALRLYTHAKMTSNVQLYEGLGYRETKREAVKVGFLVHMAKSLH